eukprot:1189900-Prorocentrum_minimum.AAC.1
MGDNLAVSYHRAAGNFSPLERKLGVSSASPGGANNQVRPADVETSKKARRKLCKTFHLAKECPGHANVFGDIINMQRKPAQLSTLD